MGSADRVPPDGTRRSALDATGAQTGDVHASGNAGRDVTNIGADPDGVVDQAFAIIRDVFLDDQKREIRQLENDRWHGRIVLALYLIGATLVVQTIALLITLAALVSLLWPRLAALV